MKKAAITTICLSAFCALASAQGKPFAAQNRPAVDIDSVVVVSLREQTAIPPQTLSGVGLARFSGRSVADAVRSFSGLQVKDYGGVGGLKTIDTRSLGSAHTGVFYDGVAVTNAQNGTVDLGRFSLAGVEAVSLYNGQKSDILQSARDFSTSAALYLVARRPVFEAGKNYNFEFHTGGGSFHTIDLGARWEQRISRAVSSVVSAEFLNTSGKYRFRVAKNDGRDTTMTRTNGDVMLLRGEVGFFGAIKGGAGGRGGGEWRVKGWLYGSQRGYPGAVKEQSKAIKLLNKDRQTDLDLFVQGSVGQRVSNVYDYRLQAKYSRTATHYTMPPEATMPADTRYRQQEAYVSLANGFRAARPLSFSVSVDGAFTALDARGTMLGNFTRPRRLTLWSAAAMSVALPKFNAQASILHTFTHDMSAAGQKTARDRNVFTPSVVLSWRPFNRVELDFRAFYKQIFRLPTFGDLYYVNIGNRNLRPERAEQYNIGVAWRKQWPRVILTVSVDGYFNRVRDKIIATPTSNQLVWTMLNLGYVEIIGTDVALGAEFRAGAATITLRGNYTFQQAQDFSPSRRPKPNDPPTVYNGFGDQIPYVPRHSGSANLALAWRDWDFSYGFLYTGERWSLGYNLPENRVPPCHLHDIATSYRFRFTGGVLYPKTHPVSLRLTAQVNNILNRQYQIVAGYPMPGTNFKLILTLNL